MGSFEDWFEAGLRAGWCGPVVCATHDGVPSTLPEDELDEPCIPVIRLYEDDDTRAAVEANHPPSVWRRPERQKS